MTDSSGVQWDDLWNAIRNNPNGDHKHRYENIGKTNDFKDLLPKIAMINFQATSKKQGNFRGDLEIIVQKDITLSARYARLVHWGG